MENPITGNSVPAMLRLIFAGLAVTAVLAAPFPAQTQDPVEEQAQEEEQNDGSEGAAAESDETADVEVDESGVEEPVLEDSELDDQTYEGDDDIFVPTEEIPTDEPIPFPSDI